MRDRTQRQSGWSEQVSKHRDTQQMLVGLDIGTSKIVAIVAEVTDEGTINIVGMGDTPSRGLRKGMVVNIEATVKAIEAAVREAELMADCKINEVYTGIAGSHIKSVNSHGMVAIGDREVTQADIDRVIDTARAVSIPSDHQTLHVLPQEFCIDGQEDVREPLGMSGVRLEARVHIVTGAVSAAQNITKCVRRCGLEANDLILQPLASAEAVLTEDERDLGVCLIDIGGGTTDIAVLRGGAVRHTAVIPIAGDQITNDIAMALRTPTKEAEEIKIAHGVALSRLTDPAQMIDVPGVGERGPRQLSRATLAEVIEPRVEELFVLVQQELKRAGFDGMLASGIVLTGGSSQLPGMCELAEEVFHLPVRVGVPQYYAGLAEVVRKPSYSTAVGLLLLGKEQMVRQAPVKVESGGIGSIFERMKSWFGSNF